MDSYHLAPGYFAESASVSLRQRHAVLRGFAAHEALARGLLVRVDRADGDPARLGIDPCLAFGVPAPRRPYETGALPEVRDHLGQRRQLERVLASKLLRALEEPRLECHELRLQPLRDAGDRHWPPLPRQSIHELHLPRVAVPPADVQTHGAAPELPVRA